MTMVDPDTEHAVWRPHGQSDLAPPGAKAKARANLDALKTLRGLQRTGGTATPGQAALLARWAGWGALPNIFDERDPEWAAERIALRQLLLDDAEWRAARDTTLNAHYTSAEVVAAMWQTALELGFTGGRVLEPGCGSGNFIGLAPDVPTDWVGIEVDPVTAAIAGALYPWAEVRCQGFEDSRFAPGHFDLVIGNVPFAKIALHDVEHNRARHSMHNHFILKALDFLRPGGLMLVLTSRYTLDSRNPLARREMAELAELVGAVRLPEGAFQASAGTRAMEDLLVLRRRTAAISLFSSSWSALRTVTTSTGDIEVNEYFADHPDRMVGTPGVGRGMYRDNELTLGRPDDLPGALTAALSGVVADALAAELGWVEPPRPVQPSLRTVSKGAPAKPSKRVAPAPTLQEAVADDPDGILIPPPPRKEGTILATDGPTGFGQVSYGVIVDYAPRVAGDSAELGALVRLRDVVAALLDVQSSSADDNLFAAFQAALNRCYDAYVSRWGAICRFSTARTGRTNGEGEEVMRRVRPRMGGFRLADPDFPSLVALEIFDPETQTAQKAPIFSVRVVAPRERPDKAESARDALSMCLDQYGDVRLDVVAQLLRATTDEARAQLGELVWEDPATGELETAARYLSGHVRSKLTQARRAAEDDPRFQAQVEALEKVLPEDLPPTEIDAQLGATWIEESDIEAFLGEVLQARGPDVVHMPVTATWKVTVDAWQRRQVAMSSTWGTTRCDGAEVVELSLNQKPATVYDTLADGTRVLNSAETLAAREKQEALEERFREWVWEDHDRASRLARVYNERFNSTVEPRFDGSHLTLPGVSSHFDSIHPHQLDSIWRIICEPTVGLFHPVGAGKTFVMAAAAMELRRLGLVRKPVIVVPNHMLEQFCAELIQHYPRARVLLATKEQTEAGARKAFVARCATGDWDAVIITRSAFERIPVSARTRAGFLADKIGALEKAIDENEERTSIKRLAAQVVKLRERHDRLLAEHLKDNGVSFEEAGFDYVIADEAHAYKNMAFPTHMRSVGGEGSQRAEDLECKIGYLRRRFGARVCTLATATPVANSLAEIFVMQRYLQPDDLVAAGAAEFDQWAANFGRTVNQLELAPDGSSWRVGSRFARFRNVPDLMRMFRLVADIKTPEDLRLPVPALAGGAAEVVVAPPTPALEAYMTELARRAENIRNRRVHPTEDNMLTVSTDGRKAALHLRLVQRAPDGDDKVVLAAERIAAIYHAHSDVRYRDPAGNVAARTGAFQLVFCDLGTPHEGQWSVYEHLRQMLVARGVPADRVRFVHEATDDRRKAEMFAACRDGRIAVLIASTEKAGVGTNIQARMLALHHLDCPWRPCDIEQREGRELRQGNQNTTVQVLRYVTEASFDIYLWQTVARKAGFIYQVMSGKFRGREVDDLGEVALSYAEVKALATGNPLLMEQAGVDNEVAKLTRARRSHFQDQSRLLHLIEGHEVAIPHWEREAAEYTEAIARRTITHGDDFAMKVGKQFLTKRADAGQALLHVLEDGIRRAYSATELADTVAEIGGQVVLATWTRHYSAYYGSTVEVGLRFEDTAARMWFTREEVSRQDPQGLVYKLENKLAGFETARHRALDEVERCRSELAQARERHGAPFAQEAELVRLTHRAAEIAETLAELAAQKREGKTA